MLYSSSSYVVSTDIRKKFIIWIKNDGVSAWFQASYTIICTKTNVLLCTSKAFLSISLEVKYVIFSDFGSHT